MEKPAAARGFFCCFTLNYQYIGLLCFRTWRFVFGINQFRQGDEICKWNSGEARLRRNGRTGIRKPVSSFGIEKTQRHEDACNLLYGHYL
jgi:hypothetical protein